MHMILLDSGISEFQHNVSAVDIGYGVYDENGHGTKIVDIVNKVAGFAKITSIKILNKCNECRLEDLIKALDICANMDADVLCMSMTLESNGNFWVLKKIIERISRKGTLIVAPLHNRKNYAIPAAYRNVVGVRALISNDKEYSFYSGKARIQCQIPIIGAVCKTIGNSYAYFNGNSCACAFFSAELLCRLRTMALSSVSDVNKLYRTIDFEDTYIYPYLNQAHPNIGQDIFSDIQEHVINTLKKCACSRWSEDHLYERIPNIAVFVDGLSNIGLQINNSSFLCVRDLENIDSLTRYLCTQNPDFTQMQNAKK